MRGYGDIREYDIDYLSAEEVSELEGALNFDIIKGLKKLPERRNARRESLKELISAKKDSCTIIYQHNMSYSADFMRNEEDFYDGLLSILERPFDVSACCIGSRLTQEQILLTLAVLEYCENLRYLKFYQVHSDKGYMMGVTKLLDLNENLVCLRFKGCFFDKKGVEFLVGYLKENRTLVSLDMRDSDLNDASPFEDLLKVNNTLLGLRLRCNSPAMIEYLIRNKEYVSNLATHSGDSQYRMFVLSLLEGQRQQAVDYLNKAYLNGNYQALCVLSDLYETGFFDFSDGNEEHGELGIPPGIIAVDLSRAREFAICAEKCRLQEYDSEYKKHVRKLSYSLLDMDREGCFFNKPRMPVEVVVKIASYLDGKYDLSEGKIREDQIPRLGNGQSGSGIEIPSQDRELIDYPAFEKDVEEMYKTHDKVREEKIMDERVNNVLRGVNEWVEGGRSNEWYSRVEAKRRIVECIREGNESLDLRGLGLTALPDAIGRLSNLVSLDLRGNNFKDLPSNLYNLTKLSGSGLSVDEPRATTFVDNVSRAVRFGSWSRRVEPTSSLNMPRIHPEVSSAGAWRRH